MSHQTKQGTSLPASNYKQKLAYRKLQPNLRKKAIREARNRNETVPGAPKPRRRRPKKPDPECIEHAALVAATNRKIKEILAQCDVLADIPYDCTAEEILGELHQQKPTIANLKHAIAKLSIAEQKRTQREQQRHEERIKRRRRHSKAMKIDGDDDDDDDDDDDEDDDCDDVDDGELVASRSSRMLRSSGELVCSALRNGHQHRANVSWRFLWRAYTLHNVDTNQPIDDANGRALLTDLGIENATTLKFSHRVKYFGRKRQK